MSGAETILLFIAGLLTGTGTGGLLAFWLTARLDRHTAGDHAIQIQHHTGQDMNIITAPRTHITKDTF